MQKLYTLQQHPSRRCTVQIIFGAGYWGNEYQALIDQQLESMLDWCRISGVGNRTSWNHITFSNLKEMSLFMLKWA
jgi:hypothetical protein